MADGGAVHQIGSAPPPAKFFEGLLRASPDGIAVTDAAQTIVLVNEAFCELLFAPWREVVETSALVWMQQLAGDAPQRWAELEREARLKGTCRGVELRITKNGETRYLAVNASRLRTPAEAETGMLSIWRDVTDQIAAEKALLASQTRLWRAERLASVATLAGGIAHEINNPAGSILAAAEFAQLVKDEPEGPQQAETAFKTIIEEAHRCGRIVKSVLALTPGWQSDRAIGDLNNVLRDSCDLLIEHANERGARIEWDLGTDLPAILLSPQEIEQLLSNLVRNSVESGADRIVVITRAHQTVRLTVEDNGPGIPAEIRERIFDPFFTTRRQRGGTGLGLSLVWGIVLDHGGTLHVESASGGGARLVAEFPRAVLPGSATREGA